MDNQLQNVSLQMLVEQLVMTLQGAKQSLYAVAKQLWMIQSHDDWRVKHGLGTGAVKLDLGEIGMRLEDLPEMKEFYFGISCSVLLMMYNFCPDEAIWLAKKPEVLKQEALAFARAEEHRLNSHSRSAPEDEGDLATESSPTSGRMAVVTSTLATERPASRYAGDDDALVGLLEEVRKAAGAKLANKIKARFQKEIRAQSDLRQENKMLRDQIKKIAEDLTMVPA